MDDSPRVLYVQGHQNDDELERRLVAESFDVSTVTDARAAQVLVSDTDIDCVVTRFDVPRSDGREFLGGLHVLDTIRETDPDIPVILFTDIEDRDVGKEVSGADLYDYVPNRPDDDSIGYLLTQVKNATRQYRTEKRVEQLSRINEIIRDVNQELVRTDSRKSIERAVCQELTKRRAYALALYSPDSGDPFVAINGGISHPQDRKDLLADLLDDAGPSTHVKRLDETWTPYATAAVIPIKYSERSFGSLVLCATRERAFGGNERAVLSELGETIAYAFDAVVVRQELAHRERELEAQNERLANFASVVSHDLRNPLQVAHGTLELLDEDYDDERFDTLGQSLSRIGGIIDDVLSLARGGEQTLSLETVDVEHAVEKAWKHVHTDGATLEYEGLDAVEADEDRFTRLLENLFRNAVEHGSTGNGEATVDVSTVTVTVEQGDDWFAVTDDGPGIPADQRESILEMGYTTESSGTGIGLSIVTNIAESHGWSLSVTDGDAGGARFEFETDAA